MTTIIERLAENTIKINYDDISENERHQIKRVILDRMGSGIAAARLKIREELIQYFHENSSPREASIWGTPGKISRHHAALLNGSISAHLEYSPHNSMIPPLLALAETKKTTGKHLITALSAGHKVEYTVNRLLASPVEKKGMHWPAYLAGFPAAAACCKLMNLNKSQTENALSLVGCLNPAAPFEAFTKGASSKDIYDGWGSYLGILCAELASIGMAGPVNLFEGERGLGKMWLEGNISPELIENGFRLVPSKEIRLGIKPYPSCAAAHPTLTALEKLIAKNPINIAEIDKIEITTYRFGASLSNASTFDTPISAKVNIPYLSAAMLKYGEILPSYSEEPFIYDPEMLELARKITVNTLPEEQDSVYSRRCFAKVDVTFLNGSRVSENVDASKWSYPEQASDDELIEKYRKQVGGYIPSSQRDSLEHQIMKLEEILDVSEIVKLTIPIF